MNTPAVRVLYIAGNGRSGSTLLGRLLGQHPAFCAVGELFALGPYGLERNQLCGCGRPFRECPFWNEVGDAAFGGWRPADQIALNEIYRDCMSLRRKPALLLGRLGSTGLAEYGGVLSRLYAALAQVSGRPVIVDGSKSVAFLLLLSQTPGIDVRVVHLVRDSRAVAYSYQRRKRDPSIVARSVNIETQRPAAAALQWAGTSLWVHASRPALAALPWQALQYERLAAQPGAALKTVAAHAGLADAEFAAFKDERTVTLRSNCTLAGNPNRFTQGDVTIHPDMEWRLRLGRGSRAVVTALTWPLLLGYGYL